MNRSLIVASGSFARIDFIVASERAVFAITPAKIGVIYPRPGIERLVQHTLCELVVLDL